MRVGFPPSKIIIKIVILDVDPSPQSTVYNNSRSISSVYLVTINTAVFILGVVHCKETSL